MSRDKEILSDRDYAELKFKDIHNHKQLDPQLVQGIIKCVHASGMRTTDEDVLNHIEGDLVIVYKDLKTQDVIAFSSTSFISPNEHLKTNDVSDDVGCFLVGATIVKDWQGHSLYSKMNETRIGFGLDRGLNLVFTQTQNRRVVHGIESVLNEFIKKGFIIGYEMEDPILRPGHYGRMLTEEMPLKFEGLDYENGDCYTLLFHLQR